MFQGPEIAVDVSLGEGTASAKFFNPIPGIFLVLSGKFRPQGKLPFALANKLNSVIHKQSDVPGYPAANTWYPYAFGLEY